MVDATCSTKLGRTMTKYDRKRFPDLFTLVESQCAVLQDRFKERGRLFSKYTWFVIEKVGKELLNLKSSYFWFVVLTLFALGALVYFYEDELVFNSAASLYASVIGFSGAIAALMIASFAFFMSQEGRSMESLDEEMGKDMDAIVNYGTQIADETLAKLWILVRSVDERRQSPTGEPNPESPELLRARKSVGRHSYTNRYLSELPVRTYGAIAPFLVLAALSLVLLPHAGETSDRLWGVWAPCAVIWLAVASIAFLASYLKTLFGNVSLRNEDLWRRSSYLGRDGTVRELFVSEVLMELAGQTGSVVGRRKAV